MFRSLHSGSKVRIVNGLQNLKEQTALALQRLSICNFFMCLKATILFGAIRLLKEVPTCEQRGPKVVKAAYQKLKC